MANPDRNPPRRPVEDGSEEEDRELGDLDPDPPTRRQRRRRTPPRNGNRRRPNASGVLGFLTDCFALNRVVCTVCLALVLLLVTVANLALEAVSTASARGEGDEGNQTGVAGVRTGLHRLMMAVEENIRKQLPKFIADATNGALAGRRGRGEEAEPPQQDDQHQETLQRPPPPPPQQQQQQQPG